MEKCKNCGNPPFGNMDFCSLRCKDEYNMKKDTAVPPAPKIVDYLTVIDCNHKAPPGDVKRVFESLKEIAKKHKVVMHTVKQPVRKKEFGPFPCCAGDYYYRKSPTSRPYLCEVIAFGGTGWQTHIYSVEEGVQIVYGVPEGEFKSISFLD